MRKKLLPILLMIGMSTQILISSAYAMDVKQPRANINVAKRESILISTKKILSNSGNISIDIKCPQVRRLSSADAQNKINSILNKEADDLKNEALKSSEEYSKDGITNIKIQAVMSYKIKYNQNGILSIVLEKYLYTGGAHGMSYQKSYTFDLKTGKELKLKDLFKEKTDYISVINAEIKKQMNEKEITASLLTPFESIKADQDFYITNDSLVIYFQRYEYTPYSYGIPEFSINFSKFKENLTLSLLKAQYNLEKKSVKNFNTKINNMK